MATTTATTVGGISGTLNNMKLKDPGEKDPKVAQAVAKRFRQAVDKGEDTQKMRAIISMCTRDEMMAAVDDHGLDLLHYCILRDNAEAADFLLKQGYFARPHEPQLSLYLHLAAFMGLKTMITVLVQHRPDDFRPAPQPLLVPPEYLLGGGGGGGPDSSSASGRSRQFPDTSTASTGRTESNPVKKATSNISKLFGADTSRGSLSRVSRADTQSARARAGTDRTAKPGTTLKLPDSSGKNKLKPEDGLQSKGGDNNAGGFKACSRRNSLDGLKLDGSTPLLRTPLYVAAVVRKVDCVRVLLDTCVLKANPEAPNKGYFTLAALADCPTTMALLVKNMDTRDKSLSDDYKAAVTYCVHSARPECLDLLLGSTPKEVDIRNLFKGINFYHVLYTFSASYGKGVYGRLPDTTRVLIKYNHDVTAKVPPRTYPLYTLLTHSISYQDYSVMKYYIECMKMLLDGGADPNFDEVRFEVELLKKRGIKFAAGRNAYSSALHCMMETVETFASLLESKYLAVKFIEECAETLVSHKADMTKVGRIGDARSTLQGNILHQYAKSSVIIGVDRAVIQCILRYGGEPNVKISGKYAINVYFDKLFELFGELKVVDVKHKYEQDINQILTHFSRFMTSQSLREAAHIFQVCHGRNQSTQVKYYLEKVIRELDQLAREVPSLQRIAAWRVWLLCKKRPEAVRSLPVKVELKTAILPLLPEVTKKVYMPIHHPHS